MLLKCCTQYVSKFGKLSSSHRTGKGQYSLQSQRWAIPRNVQTIIQMHSFHMLARLSSKSFKLSFSSTVNQELPDVQAGFWKSRGIRDQPALLGTWRKQETSRKTSTSSSLTMLKPLTVLITTYCGKLLKIWEYQTTLPVSWETCICASRSNR